MVGEYLSATTKLQCLNLYDNYLDDVSLELISNSLFENRSLKKLNLGKNDFSVKGLHHLCDSIKTNSSLEILYLSENKIDHQGAKEICEFLRINNFLKALNLSKNDLSSNGSLLLSNSLPFNDSLKTLQLSHNSIGDVGCSHLFQSSNNLINLDLSDNHISPKGAIKILKFLQSNISLEQIHLHSNAIRGDVLKQINSYLHCNLKWSPEIHKSINLAKFKQIVSLLFIFFKTKNIPKFVCFEIFARIDRKPLL